MRRCIELARQGAASVAPNPMVGAVLVHNGRIIGEGYHQVYGKAHAEVNCINSVAPRDVQFISSSTLYVSLEPCAHHGKTPPCADLIIRHSIPHVVVGCRDPFHAVDGKGLEKLAEAGVEVTEGVLEEDCRNLNARFFTFHTKHRPYVVLKWAETADHKIGNYGNNRLLITSQVTNRLVHRWRSEEMAIMVGTNTAAMDNPQLTNRWWYGSNPIRVVVDADLSLERNLHLFDSQSPTVVFNLLMHDESSHIKFYQYSEDASLVHQVLNGLRQMNITSVLIEGGAKLLQSFIDDSSWDEARVITNTLLRAPAGVPSPVLKNHTLFRKESIGGDDVYWYVPEPA